MYVITGCGVSLKTLALSPPLRPTICLSSNCALERNLTMKRDSLPRLAMPNRRWTCLALAVIGLTGCGDSCREYSAYSCDQLARANYNVYFYYPESGSEVYLGVASGLAGCGGMARSFASSKGLGASSGWNYVCCLKTDSSDCTEKHR